MSTRKRTILAVQTAALTAVIIGSVATSEAADWQLLGHLFVEHAAPMLVSAERTALDAELARIPAQLAFDVYQRVGFVAPAGRA